MAEIIRLGRRKPVSTYGKFLIVKGSLGSYSFWDTENNCEISPVNLDMDENIPWCDIKVLDDCVILTAFPTRLPLEKASPTSGYTRGVQCVFIKAKGEFLVIPGGCCQHDMTFDEIRVEGGMIWCTVTSYEKTTSEYWFDLAGNWRATKLYKQEDKFYTVTLSNGDKIEKVCEVHQVEDEKSHIITGLYIICLTKNKTEVNLFYPF